MKHFDITQWTDFARETATVANRAAMEAHVAGGCSRCRSTLDLVTRIVAVARAEERHEPPEYVVRCAKAIYALRRPEKLVHRLLARLVRDSFSGAVPAGLRTQDRVSRHALYEAGNYCIDLRLEQERESPRVTLVGQVTNRKAPDAFAARVPVLLTAHKDVIAHTVSGPLGEFQMEYAPVPHLRLHVSLGPAGRLELSLPRLETDLTKRRPRTTKLGRPGRGPAGRAPK